MNEILKRLEIIKSSLSIDDDEIIELQIIKLNKLSPNIEVKNIILKLENNEYSSALIDIENYLKRYSSIVEYIDTEVQSLKLELKSLESKLQDLSEQKTEYLNDIEEFNTLYNLHLGELLKTILNLRKEILYKQTIKQQQNRKKYEEDIEVFNSTKENIEEIKQTIEEFEKILEVIDKDDENYDEIYASYKELQEELEKLKNELEEQEENLSKTKEEIENNEVFEEYEESKKQYEQFHQNYEDIKQQQLDIFDITDEQKSELKKLWKKACKLCHPDIVIDKFKEKAHEIMQALNDAYSKKDIVKVKEILSNLENGLTFEIESDNINDKELLKSKINLYKRNILKLENEIENLKQDETYQTIQEIDDMDKYFEELKSELQSEKDRLEKEAKGILQKSDDENNHIEEQHKEKIIKYNLYAWWIESTLIDINNSPKFIDDGFGMIILLTKYSEPLNVANYKNHDELLYDLNIYQNSLQNPDCAFIQVKDDGKVLFYDKTSSLYSELMSGLTVRETDYTNEAEDEYNENYEKLIENIYLENSEYSKYIQSIENIKFEKIRKYCENLVKSNEADEMQKELAEDGKMKRALVFDALEQFIEKLNGKTISIIDWGCGQGIGSMLVIDYIKEKQLDITVDQVFLIDTDEKVLSRAIAQVNSLKQNELETIALDSNGALDNLTSIKNSITLNLIVNDVMPVDTLDIDFNLFKNAYFLCLSNKSEDFINEICDDLTMFADGQDISTRDNKIGRFERHERIYHINNSVQYIPEIDIDDDEIPY